MKQTKWKETRFTRSFEQRRRVARRNGYRLSVALAIYVRSDWTLLVYVVARVHRGGRDVGWKESPVIKTLTPAAAVSAFETAQAWCEAEADRLAMFPEGLR